MGDRIVLTESDATRLRELTADLQGFRGTDRITARRLRQMLDYAKIVPWQSVEREIVTVLSRVFVRDENSGQRLSFELVFPEAADYRTGRISVLAPIGAAILGHREGEIVEWEGSVGALRLRILKVLYQPEAVAISA